MVPVVEPDADELAGIVDGRVQPNGVGGMAARARTCPPWSPPPWRPACPGWPIRLRGSRACSAGRARPRWGGADHALAGEPGGAARFEVDHAVLAHEAAEARGVAVLREPDDLHMGLLGGPMGGRKGRARNHSTVLGAWEAR